MITLPVHPRRALRTSFWAIACAGSGAAVGTCVRLMGLASGLTVGVVWAAGACLLGMLWPQLVSFAYRAWNGAARRVTRRGRAALLWICYFIVLLAVGKRGGRFIAEVPTSPGSLWTSRKTLAPEAYRTQFDAVTNGAAAEGWMREYASWAVRSKNHWAIALLPFLALIAMLEEHEQPGLSATIYTLF